MSNDSKNQILTTTEVGKLLNIHINTVRRWSDQGILKPCRIGLRGDRRFRRDDVLGFLATQQYVNTFKDANDHEIGNNEI